MQDAGRELALLDQAQLQARSGGKEWLAASDGDWDDEKPEVVDQVDQRGCHSGRASTGKPHRHLHEGEGAEHRHDQIRSPRQAFGIGLLHGLAGTGAVVVLLLAALPSQLEAGLALAVFAPMSIVSMALCTAAFGWVLTRPVIEPLYRSVLIPALGVFGITFGLWYTGLV